MKKIMLIWVCKREWSTPFQPSPFKMSLCVLFWLSGFVGGSCCAGVWV